MILLMVFNVLGKIRLFFFKIGGQIGDLRHKNTRRTDQLTNWLGLPLLLKI